MIGVFTLCDRTIVWTIDNVSSPTRHFQLKEVESENARECS
jgi:hypothetical protein